jgi:hypothetical protein
MPRMSNLQAVATRYDAWRNGVLEAAAPFLAEARAQMVAAQSGPEADDAIARAEELVGAELEPIFLKQERALAPIQRAVDAYFETAAEPSDADYAIQERVGQGLDGVRDWVSRKIASMVAQARAQELAPGPRAAAKTGFCRHCGAPLTAPMQEAKRCGFCHNGI